MTIYLDKSFYNFILKKEMHHDGEFWEGYQITKISVPASPDECIECNKWFKKEDTFNRVYHTWCCGDPEGHWTEDKEIGQVCNSCLQKILQKQTFREAKQA